MLLLFYHFQFIDGFTILENLDFHDSVTTVYPIGFIYVTVIIIDLEFRFEIAQMFIQFCMHHFIDGAAKKVYDCFLNAPSVFNIVPLQQTLNDILYFPP